MVTFQCDFCDAVLKVPDAHAGKTVHCPKCRNTIEIPAAHSKARDSTQTESAAGMRQQSGNEKTSGVKGHIVVKLCDKAAGWLGALNNERVHTPVCYACMHVGVWAGLAFVVIIIANGLYYAVNNNDFASVFSVLGFGVFLIALLYSSVVCGEKCTSKPKQISAPYLQGDVANAIALILFSIGLIFMGYSIIDSIQLGDAVVLLFGIPIGLFACYMSVRLTEAQAPCHEDGDGVSLGVNAIAIARQFIKAVLSAAPILYSSAIAISTILYAYHLVKLGEDNGDRYMYGLATFTDAAVGVIAIALPLICYLLCLLWALMLDMAEALIGRDVPEASKAAGS